MADKTLTQLAVDAYPAMRKVDALTCTEKADDLFAIIVALDAQKRINNGENAKAVFDEIIADITKEKKQ